ncbi:MAG: hypothetical protein NE328_14230 [Lentisphaeraceae bacterium]|nr:hypothetical protein [Lentisphaeraceae bacterium]
MNIKQTIKENGQEICRLHKLVHSTFARKNESEQQKLEWVNACEDFRKSYPKLCYWNGIEDYRNELRSGNIEAIEYYISFIEIRPYFFWSGHIYKDLMRVFKNLELTKEHKARFEVVKKNYEIYKEERTKKE